MPQSTLLFRFAVIADIQYADIDDAMNFTRTENRGYRATLNHFKTTIHHWNQLKPAPTCIVQLGDLIDGQNSGTYGQGLAFDSSKSQFAFRQVLSLCNDLNQPMYHCIGNHEKYNFSWESLALAFDSYQKETPTHQAQHLNTHAPFYSDFLIHPGWRGIILNPYQVSLLQDKKSQGYQDAVKYLHLNNPTVLNPNKKVDYFKNVKGLQQRFVPFNGGFGDTQLAWFAQCLQQAVSNDEKIIIFSHLPLSAAASNAQNIAYDYDLALTSIADHAPHNVKAVFAGHYHRGGYAQDKAGIHHITVQSPLTHGYCAAHIEVYAHALSVVGMGAHRSYHLAI